MVTIKSPAFNGANSLRWSRLEYALQLKIGGYLDFDEMSELLVDSALGVNQCNVHNAITDSCSSSNTTKNPDAIRTLFPDLALDNHYGHLLVGLGEKAARSTETDEEVTFTKMKQLLLARTGLNTIDKLFWIINAQEYDQEYHKLLSTHWKRDFVYFLVSRPYLSNFLYPSSWLHLIKEIIGMAYLYFQDDPSFKELESATKVEIAAVAVTTTVPAIEDGLEVEEEVKQVEKLEFNSHRTRSIVHFQWIKKFVDLGIFDVQDDQDDQDHRLFSLFTMVEKYRNKIDESTVFDKSKFTQLFIDILKTLAIRNPSFFACDKLLKRMIIQMNVDHCFRSYRLPRDNPLYHFIFQLLANCRTAELQNFFDKLLDNDFKLKQAQDRYDHTTVLDEVYDEYFKLVGNPYPADGERIYKLELEAATTNR